MTRDNAESLETRIRWLIEVLEKPDNEREEIRQRINNEILGKGPDLYFYKKVVTQTKQASPVKIRRLLKKQEFIELLYATLASWGMHSRGAKMKSFEEFFLDIRRNRDRFVKLSIYGLEYLQETIENQLLELFDNLNVMVSKEKIVANSKLMHFVLPNLVMPIDREHTLKFFKEYRKSKECDGLHWRTFLRIHECVVHQVIKGREDRLKKLLDNEWNQTIPKVIDNLIIYYVETHCKKKK